MVILRNLLVLLAWFGACQAADTSVFSYTAADGSVSLSNVPTDTRFTLLIADRSARPTNSGRTIRLPQARNEHDEVIGRVATQYGLDSALLHALITVESGYDAAASSSKGAQGLMQLMPGTAKRYGVADAF
ncbi:MAG: transglycosylase SLT domain-containing protein, partial [Propionivibrio sp.]